ncbi:MAG: hypothetical protein Q9195_005181 [Heterodermia aff. obscurata]
MAQDQTHLLQSSDQLRLLDEVDKLRSQGISHYLSLPQLVVVGDQSSGKSSVLGAISGITFPTKDELCTCFATEVILRKAASINISVNIIPSKHRTPAEEAKLKGFNKTLQDLEEFAAVVDKAKEAMGVSDTTGAFSNDVLRVEISGPDKPHLTIVDLPGLIHTENKKQTAADLKLVWGMVRAYMENKRSIILAVISAKNDYANQAVLKLAKEIDSSGTRTLGVITKPDMLPVGSESERSFVGLSKNEDIVFRLGWHIVRNRNYEERNVSNGARDANEAAFFSDGIWKNLARTMVGIKTLRTRLSKVLLDQIKAELPELVLEIENNLEDCETKLARLGTKRTTIEEQRFFLLQVGQSFQSLAKAAVGGAYDDAFFGDSSSGLDYAKRLRAVVQNLNLDFADTMRKSGQHRQICEKRTKDNKKDRIEGRVIARADFESEILVQLRSSRGRELPGMFNPMIVGEIFRQQAKPWGTIASDHAHGVWEAVKSFLGLALGALTDDDTVDGLFREVIDPLMQDRLEKLDSKLEEVLLPYVHGHPITYNHYFTETIQAIRQQRQEDMIRDRLNEKFGLNSTIPKGLQMSDLISTVTARQEADMDKFACSEILLCMEAYYKVAMKVLVDNVALQAIEACLMTHLPDIISPASVMQMEGETIRRIAAESEESQELREQLIRKATVLKSGLEICKRYTGRRSTSSLSLAPIPTAAPRHQNQEVEPKEELVQKANADLRSSLSRSSRANSSDLFEPSAPVIVQQSDSPEPPAPVNVQSFDWAPTKKPAFNFEAKPQCEDWPSHSQPAVVERLPVPEPDPFEETPKKSQNKVVEMMKKKKGKKARSQEPAPEVPIEVPEAASEHIFGL